MNEVEADALHAEIDAFLRPTSSRRALPPPANPDRALTFWQSRPVITAEEIAMLGLMIDQPMDARAIAELLGRDHRCTQAFLDALTAVGLLARRGETYSITAVTRLYLRTLPDR